MIEKNLNSKFMATANGYEIYRCEARIYDEIKDKFVGKIKVYYDVCLPDGGDIIFSGKTWKEAIKYTVENR